MDGGASESYEDGGWWTTTALWTIGLFGSVILNATLLLAFLRRPGLRTISNRFVMNLIASNLLTCTILMPLLMWDAPPESGDASLCGVSEGATALVTASSILSVLLIAIDQYFAVVDPLRYRTRIDKLKCGVLIASIWVVAILVGLVAALNPQPRSLWLSCPRDPQVFPRDSSISASSKTNLDLDLDIDNGTNNYHVRGEVTVLERNGSSIVEQEVRFGENSTTFLSGMFLADFDATTSNEEEERVWTQFATYGPAFSILYSFFVYLVPFVAVCWIYVSIYLAAHKNSERARRTGSGPMLSSSSFCEDYGPVRPDFSTDDFRRIPKISSLSSIDESIETSPSQIPRRRSEMMLSSAIEEEPSSGVVFTVGSQKVDVSPQKAPRSLYPKEATKVPISTLKAEFLGKREAGRLLDENIRSKFRDRPDDRRKSSHDILYEEMLRKDLSRLRIPEDSTDAENSDEDEIDEESGAKDMLSFTKNHRLRDIEVSKCQNATVENDNENENEEDFARDALVENVSETRVPSRDDQEEREEPDSMEMGTPVRRPDPRSQTENESNVISSPRMLGGTQNGHKWVGSGILSRAALENHNAKSKLQNHLGSYGKSMGSRYANGFHRSEIGTDHPDDVFEKQHSSAHHHVPDVESSLLAGGQATGAPMVTITPPHRPLHRVSSVKSTSSYINSLKYRISNASLFKYREETRAARISALVIVMGLICWTPYIIVLNLRNLPIASEYSLVLSHSYDVMALSFLILAAYVTPLLFGYRSRRVKKELRKIFCFKRELSYKNNRSLMAKKVLRRRHSSNLSQLEMDAKYNIFSCVYGRNRWPREKVQFMQVPETALDGVTCRSSFSSGASTQISTTSTEEC